MRVENAEVNDFYRQLSLLLAADLPLPESLNQLAAGLRRSEFQSVLQRLSTETGRGTPLADAMRACPGAFPAFHVRMIESGERSGTLPEVLAEVADMAYLDAQLADMIRSIAAYPAFVLSFSMAVLFFIYTFVVINFQPIIYEMMPGVPLPGITRLSFGLAAFLNANFTLVLFLQILFAAGALWLFFSRSRAAARVILGLIRFLPLSRQIFNNLHLARICAVWSVLIRQKMPAPEIFSTIAGLTDDRRLSAAMVRLSGWIARGESLVTGLAQEPFIPGLIHLAVAHAPENSLAQELGTIAGIFKDRAAMAIKKAGVGWEIVLLVIVSVIAGSVIISLFLPLFSLIDKLGG